MSSVMPNLYLSEEFEKSLIQLKSHQSSEAYKSLNQAIAHLIDLKPEYRDWHTMQKELKLSLREANKFSLFVKVLDEACKDDSILNRLQDKLQVDLIVYAPVFDKIQNVLAYEDMMAIDIKEVSLDLLLKEVDANYKAEEIDLSGYSHV